MPVKMALEEALSLLVDAHTKDDRQAGYVVSELPNTLPFDWYRASYVEAWGVVRERLHRQTTPGILED